MDTKYVLGGAAATLLAAGGAAAMMMSQSSSTEAEETFVAKGKSKKTSSSLPPVVTERLPSEARVTALTERKGLVNFLAGETPVGCEKHVVQSLGIELMLPQGWEKIEEQAHFPVGDCAFAPIGEETSKSMVVSVEIEVLPEQTMSIDDYHRFAWKRTNDTFEKQGMTNAYLTAPEATDYTEGISPVVRCEMKHHEGDKETTPVKIHQQIIFFAAIDGTLVYSASVTFPMTGEEAEAIKQKAEEVMHMVRRSLRTTLNHSAMSSGQPSLIVTSRKARCRLSIPLSMYCFVEDAGAPHVPEDASSAAAQHDDANPAEEQKPVAKIDMKCPFPGSVETVLGFTNTAEAVDGLTRLALLRVPVSKCGREVGAFTPNAVFIDSYKRMLNAIPGVSIVSEDDQYDGLGLERRKNSDNPPPISFFAKAPQSESEEKGLTGVGHAFVYPPMLGAEHFLAVVLWVGFDDGSYQSSPLLALIANALPPAAMEWQCPDSRKGLGLRCTYEIQEASHSPQAPSITVLLPVDVIAQKASTPLIARHSFGEAMVSIHAPYSTTGVPHLKISLLKDGRGGKDVLSDIRRQIQPSEMRRPLKSLSDHVLLVPIDSDTDSAVAVAQIIDPVVARVVAVMTVVFGNGTYSLDELKQVVPSVRRLARR